MIKAKIKFPNNWDTKDQIAIIGTPETPHAEDLADIYTYTTFNDIQIQITKNH